MVLVQEGNVFITGKLINMMFVVTAKISVLLNTGLQKNRDVCYYRDVTRSKTGFIIAEKRTTVKQSLVN